MEYYIFVTNNCNLNCQYCCGIGINKNSHVIERPQYSFEDLRQFLIDTQEKHNSDAIDIIFFGGEPTLNLIYLEEFIRYFGANLNGYAINYILHTNGVLLNEAKQNLLENLKLIIISVNYDKIPRGGLYKTYFSDIISNIKRVRALSAAKLLCRLTITERVSLYTNIMQTSSFFDYVYWQIEHCNHFTDYEAFHDNYRYELNLVFDHWYSYFKKGFLINFVPFLSAMKLLLNREQRDILCGFNTRCINIQTDGKCYSCPEAMNDNRFAIGDIWSGVKFNDFNLERMKCTTCDLSTYCCGRCGRMHIVYEKNHIEEYCKLTREMFQLFTRNEHEIALTLTQFPEIQESFNDPILAYTEYIP